MFSYVSRLPVTRVFLRKIILIRKTYRFDEQKSNLRTNLNQKNKHILR
jgi:hypothetical protein